MVMEAPPSPDSVGREFVRQYYTLLNKAPTHLHRFYNNQSSFVHGGLDPPHRETSPMIGQKEIHQKIQQLNFQDCHAKIAQVDAQATLGNGVVVQVTGELSNAGQPMRRFTQTFVLAAQSPKKYYVHNDIFRYQDEIISDEECENEARSEDDDEINMERSGVNEMAPINQQPIPYYAPNNAPLPANIPTVPHHHAPQPAPHVIPQAMPTVNGNVHPEDLNVMPAQNVPQHLPTATAPMNAAPTSGLQPSGMRTPPLIPIKPPTAFVEDSPPVIEERNTEVIENYNEPQVNNEGVEVTEPVSNEPKTYATLLKSGGGMGYSGATQSVPTFVPQKSQSPPPGNRYDNRDTLGANNQQRNRVENNRNNQRNNQQPRMPRQDSRPPRNNSNEDGINYADERRRSQSNYSEGSQLFLGHLPHNATESELREIFSQYGPILELRVHSKPSLKPGQSAGRAPLNYGFITYETALGVQTCLQAMPIYYPLNDKNGTILNVEEKKIKDRQSFGGGNGGRIGMDNNMGNRPRDNNGPRRGGMSGQSRGGGSGSMGTGPSGNRQNNFNRGPPSRGGQNNSYRR